MSVKGRGNWAETTEHCPQQNVVYLKLFTWLLPLSWQPVIHRCGNTSVMIIKTSITSWRLLQGLTLLNNRLTSEQVTSEACAEEVQLDCTCSHLGAHFRGVTAQVQPFLSYLALRENLKGRRFDTSVIRIFH